MYFFMRADVFVLQLATCFCLADAWPNKIDFYKKVKACVNKVNQNKQEKGSERDMVAMVLAKVVTSWPYGKGSKKEIGKEESGLNI